MQLQRSPLLCAPGLVKFVPAVARLVCLALPGSFLTMLAHNKGDLCKLCDVQEGQICNVHLWNIATDLINDASLLILNVVYLLRSASEGLVRTTLQPSQFRTRQRRRNLQRTFTLSQIFLKEPINARWHFKFHLGNCYLIIINMIFERLRTNVLI